MTEFLERRVVISGIGQSQVGRRLGRSGLSLTAEACLAAIADAGLERSDIDGLASYPGDMGGLIAGFDPGTVAVQDALRLQLNWHGAGNEGPGQISAIVSACLAVATGLARHVLVYRTVVGFGGTVPYAHDDSGISGPMQWLIPYGAFAGPHFVAPVAQRHMYEFGTTREHLWAIVSNARRNASLNEKAVYRDPLTIDQYLSARMVSSPLCLFDCDVPCDGSTAFVVSSADFAEDVRNGAVRLEAVGTANHGRPLMDQWGDLGTMASRDAAQQMWSRTTLRPSDVNVAELYDGFSFLTLAWLEDLGFCGKGEGGPYVEGGERIALNGELPLSTDGGQLSGGRLHGFGLLYEACLQLRGQAGERQVKDAEVAVVSNGTGTFAGCLLLTRAR